MSSSRNSRRKLAVDSDRRQMKEQEQQQHHHIVDEDDTQLTGMSGGRVSHAAECVLISLVVCISQTDGKEWRKKRKSFLSRLTFADGDPFCMQLFALIERRTRDSRQRVKTKIDDEAQPFVPRMPVHG